MAREEQNYTTRPPAPPTPPARREGFKPDTSRLVQHRDGFWYDGPTKLSMNSTKVRQKLKEEEQKRKEGIEVERINAPVKRDYTKMMGEIIREQEAARTAEAQRTAQAAQIQERLPVSIAVLAERRAQIESEIPVGAMTEADREAAIMARLTGDPNMQPHIAFVQSVSGFMEQNPGLIDPNSFIPAPVGDSSTVSNFVDNVRPDLTTPAPEGGRDFTRLPMTADEANTELIGLQNRLPPDGSPEERRAVAREMGIEKDIETLHSFVRSQPQPPQGMTLEQTGSNPQSVSPSRAGLDESTLPGVMVTPLTPQERGFVAVPNEQGVDRFRRGSAIGGVPSLQVMNELARGGYAPPAREYRGEIVGENQQFAPMPEGFTRQAVGVPGGGTIVADQPHYANTPRYGVFSNSDGSFTGMGATDEANRKFATEEEARQWSMANFDPKGAAQNPNIAAPNWFPGAESQGRATGEAAGASPPARSAPRTLGEQFAEGGIFGRGGVLDTPSDVRQMEQRDRINPMAGGGGIKRIGLHNIPFARQFFGAAVGDRADALRSQARGNIAQGPSGYVSPPPRSNPNVSPGGFTGQQAGNLVGMFRGNQQPKPQGPSEVNIAGAPPPSRSFNRVPQLERDARARVY